MRMQPVTKKALGGVLLTLGVAYLGPAGGLAQWGTQADMAKYVPLGGVTNPYWVIGVFAVLVGIAFLRAGFTSSKAKNVDGNKVVPVPEGKALEENTSEKMPRLHQLINEGDVEAFRRVRNWKNLPVGVEQDRAREEFQAYNSKMKYDGETAWEVLVKKRTWGKPTAEEDIDVGENLAVMMEGDGLIPAEFGVTGGDAADRWRDQQVNVVPLTTSPPPAMQPAPKQETKAEDFTVKAMQAAARWKSSPVKAKEVKQPDENALAWGIPLDMPFLWDKHQYGNPVWPNNIPGQLEVVITTGNIEVLEDLFRNVPPEHKKCWFEKWRCKGLELIPFALSKEDHLQDKPVYRFLYNQYFRVYGQHWNAAINPANVHASLMHAPTGQSDATAPSGAQPSGAPGFNHDDS